jgi:hypothetical protein
MLGSQDLNNDVAPSHANIRIVNEVKQAVKHAVDSIENQHNILLSVLLSVLLGIVCGRVVEGFFRHGMRILSDAIVLWDLIRFFVATLFIGSLLIIGFYLLFRGGYDSTFTLIFDASNLPKDWRSVLKNAITGAELEQRAKHYGIRNVGCRDVVSRSGDVCLICNCKYRGSIPLEIELYLFKVGNVIPLTVTLVARPFRVIIKENPITTLLNKLRAWRRKDYLMKLNVWYAAIEDLTFYFDDLVKVLSEKGIPVLDVIY